MVEFQYLTPCIEHSATCNLDWAALSALGGWAAAIVTLIAVRVALRSANDQKRAAERAVQAEREKSEELQRREWKRIDDENKRRAVHLAHAFAKELVFARRKLVPSLIDWDPATFYPGTSAVILESFVASQPFPDLVFLRSCADQLQGFEDEDVFALLSVLTAWQFYNQSPGLSIDDIKGMPAGDCSRAVTMRVKFGLELLDIIDGTINKLARYYEDHQSITNVVSEALPVRTAKRLQELRDSLCS
ncbi:hypothetical protein [Stenotrophomonas geniculata]|uniref:hypothetical protein n=1 Tax=Stenotrophomonas geniculata TaxID=86188 RepID=UPI002E777505|nr:hypothetical protein [Stenotrophomonas geniculata]